MWSSVDGPRLRLWTMDCGLWTADLSGVASRRDLFVFFGPMPNLLLNYQGAELECAMEKVDRARLYGYVSTEVHDENDAVCGLATLASDGRTLIPSGGVAMAYVSQGGAWCDRAELKAVDLAGNALTPVASTFKAPVDLTEKASCEEYLGHNIRMVYALDTADGFPEAFLKELDDGAIYRFAFSYRGGLVPDAAFLLRGEDGTVWMAAGKPAEIHFVGPEQAAGVAEAGEEEETTEEGDDLMDFGAL